MTLTCLSDTVDSYFDNAKIISVLVVSVYLERNGNMFSDFKLEVKKNSRHQIVQYTQILRVFSQAIYKTTRKLLTLFSILRVTQLYLLNLGKVPLCRFNYFKNPIIKIYRMRTTRATRYSFTKRHAPDSVRVNKTLVAVTYHTSKHYIQHMQKFRYVTGCKPIAAKILTCFLISPLPFGTAHIISTQIHYLRTDSNSRP